MFIDCDDCGTPTHVSTVTTAPYIEGTLPHVGHLGTVKDHYICMDCANEREYWKKNTGVDSLDIPGL